MPSRGAKRPASARIGEQVQRWVVELRRVMREHARSQSSIERDLGWGGGYLTQLLRPGPPALKVEHVLEILDLLGVPPENFFRGLYPDAAGTVGDAVARLIEERAQAAAESAFANLVDRLDLGGGTSGSE